MGRHLLGLAIAQVQEFSADMFFAIGEPAAK
jgi:hypothetical protein